MMNFISVKKKDVYKEILLIAIPSILESLVITFTSIIDSKMVSSLGIKAIAAISITYQPRLFILSVFLAIDIVVPSLVAKYLGEDNRDICNEILNKALKIVVVLSIMFSILSIIFARSILLAFANQPDTLNDSVMYFQIIMAGTVFNTIYMTINAAFVGSGKTNITFKSDSISCIANIIFNYLLIDGRCGFPALGIKGAAIATVIGYIMAMIYCLVALSNKNNYINVYYITDGKTHINKHLYGEIALLAKSTFTDKIAQRISLLVVGAIVARIGSLQTAVYAVCMHLMNINYAIGSGFQTASVALVGRSYGAKNSDSIEMYNENIVELTLVIAIILSILMIILRHWFINLFSYEEEFVRLGEISCIIIGFIAIFQSLKFAHIGCLQGLCDMKATMFISLVAFSVINLVLLAILVLIMGKGIYGVWISTFVTQMIQCIMAYYYVKKDINNVRKEFAK